MSKKTVLIVFLMLILIMSIVGNGFAYLKYKDLKDSDKDQLDTYKAEVAALNTSNTTLQAQLDEAQKTTNTFASKIFAVDFDYSKELGEIQSSSSKHIINGGLFCMSETLSFANSNLTVKASKGTPECTGAFAQTELESKVNSKDGKEFNIYLYKDTNQQIITATYTSSNDSTRSLRITYGSMYEVDSTYMLKHIKSIIASLSIDDTLMRSDATDTTTND